MKDFIETLNSFGADDKKYISVDRNAIGEIFINIKRNPTVADSFEDVRLELNRDEAFELANWILGNLVLYPDDQTERLNKGLKCACEHRKEYVEELEEKEIL